MCIVLADENLDDSKIRMNKAALDLQERRSCLQAS